MEVGANLLQVLYPDETKSLTKKFVIEKFECQLTQGNPFTLRCPAAQVAEMKILYGEKARVIECQRLGEDAWTATLPTKSIFNENPTVVVRYGAGHSHRFKWLDIAQDAANDLIAKLSKKKAQQYVDLVNKEEDAQITRAIEKAKDATKGSCSVLNIFRSKESEGARLGTPRADITDVIHSIDGQLELQKIDDITWAEVDLDCSAFDSFVILLTVNDANNYILFDNPIFGDRHYSKIRLYQRIPPSDLKLVRTSSFSGHDYFSRTDHLVTRRCVK